MSQSRDRSKDRDIVITGLGVVSPIGVGRQAFWDSLLAGRSGVRAIPHLPPGSMPTWIGGEVVDFDPKDHITPRKSLKVMSRDIQLAVVAANLAAADAGLTPGTIEPERLGVVLGSDMIQSVPHDVEQAFRDSIVDGRFDFDRWGPSAMRDIFPLWFLKHLPNMPACHVGIPHDARGPNNTITLDEASSLWAVAEAARVIERGDADAMFCGGVGSRVHPTPFVRSFARQVSRRNDDPAGACRPFDADRDGLVNGEGAAVFILETRQRAQARGARVLARVLGSALGFHRPAAGQPPQGTAIRATIARALAESRLAAVDVGHVNAHAPGMTVEDAVEAQAIRDALGDVPVTAPKSYFGLLGSGGGAVELAASVLGLAEDVIPPTLNYQRPDPACPVNVIHGGPLTGAKGVCVKLSQSPFGQAAALVVARA
jgi:3-oxoacyl-[acyl-carrier-protein] synthase II